MEFIEQLLIDDWRYIAVVIGIGFIVFGMFCNKIKLPSFLTRNPNATYSLGLRIVYILLGIGSVVYSIYS